MKVVLIVLALLAAGTLPARALPPTERLEKLAYGLNLSHWFAQAPNYDNTRLARFVSKADLDRIKAAGFRHVRLGVDPTALAQHDVAEKLTAALQDIVSAGLAVVVDLHPDGSDKSSYRSPKGRSDLRATWDRLAQLLVSFDPASLFLEVLNEPHPLEAEEWRTLQDELIGVIRARAPEHTLIVNPGGWSGIDNLVTGSPVADKNVVYTVHWYAPLLFTHQGADWSWAVAQRVGPVGWPVGAAAADRVARAATRDEEARAALTSEIGGARFETSYLESQFAELAAWRQRHDVAVYVGEFGVYADRAPRPAALAWIAATSAATERHGIGWAYWDSSPSFGLVAATKDGRMLRPDMLTALGLRAP